MAGVRTSRGRLAVSGGLQRCQRVRTAAELGQSTPGRAFGAADFPYRHLEPDSLLGWHRDRHNPPIYDLDGCHRPLHDGSQRFRVSGRCCDCDLDRDCLSIPISGRGILARALSAPDQLADSRSKGCPHRGRPDIVAAPESVVDRTARQGRGGRKPDRGIPRLPIPAAQRIRRAGRVQPANRWFPGLAGTERVLRTWCRSTRASGRSVPLRHRLGWADGGHECRLPYVVRRPGRWPGNALPRAGTSGGIERRSGRPRRQRRCIRQRQFLRQPSMSPRLRTLRLLRLLRRRRLRQPSVSPCPSRRPCLACSDRPACHRASR